DRVVSDLRCDGEAAPGPFVMTDTLWGVPMTDRLLLSEFDHLDSSVPGTDVLATYERAREECPVAQVPHYGGYGLVSRHEDVRAVALDPDRFRSGDGVFIPPSGLPPVPPMEYDGDARRRWRTILQGALSPG